MILRTTRQYASTVLDEFFPYINMYKQTRINNVAHLDKHSEEYLTCLMINCLLGEIESLIKRKLALTKLPNVKVEFTDAQAVLLFKTLKEMPIDGEKIFLNMVRNQWLMLLDAEIQDRQVYWLNKPVKHKPPKHSAKDYFSY